FGALLQEAVLVVGEVDLGTTHDVSSIHRIGGRAPQFRAVGQRTPMAGLMSRRACGYAGPDASTATAVRSSACTFGRIGTSMGRCDPVATAAHDRLWSTRWRTGFVPRR